jgi:hypothetical protein
VTLDQWAAAITAFAVAVVLTFPTTSGIAQDVANLIVPHGGAAGGDALVIPNGDLQGVRNIQGGSLANPPESLNLDIGAGSTQDPGNLVLNYDVGRDTLIYDGRKHLLARFSSNGITFYVRPRYRGAGWLYSWGPRR